MQPLMQVDHLNVKPANLPIGAYHRLKLVKLFSGDVLIAQGGDQLHGCVQASGKVHRLFWAGWAGDWH